MVNNYKYYVYDIAVGWVMMLDDLLNIMKCIKILWRKKYKILLIIVRTSQNFVDKKML